MIRKIRLHGDGSRQCIMANELYLAFLKHGTPYVGVLGKLGDDLFIVDKEGRFNFLENLDYLVLVSDIRSHIADSI